MLTVNPSSARVRSSVCRCKRLAETALRDHCAAAWRAMSCNVTRRDQTRHGHPKVRAAGRDHAVRAYVRACVRLGSAVLCPVRRLPASATTQANILGRSSPAPKGQDVGHLILLGAAQLRDICRHLLVVCRASELTMSAGVWIDQSVSQAGSPLE